MRDIIIKIPDTAYEGILNADKAGGNWGEDLLGILCNAITHGSLLPEGHGRLIDGNYLKGILKCEEYETCIWRNCSECEYNREKHKTGHWIYSKAVNTGEIIFSECSVCGNGESRCTKRMNYCPNCGAKMAESEGNNG